MRNRKILYLDSDIVTKAGIFLKLMLSGENNISLQELLSFNKKWALAIIKQLDYDEYHAVPREKIEDVLAQISLAGETTGVYKVEPVAISSILSSLDKYRNEMSANRMFMSVFDNMLFDYAKTIKPAIAKQTNQNLTEFVESNYLDQNAENAFSTRFTKKELLGKVLLVYNKIYLEKPLGFNFDFSLQNEEEIDNIISKLDEQEQMYDHALKDNNLAPNELASIAKAIKEKRFYLMEQKFIAKKMHPNVVYDTITPPESKYHTQPTS